MCNFIFLIMLNYIIINNIIMTMPLSGTVISFSDLEAVFGGEHPINIDEYYLNASTGYTSGVTGIPNINSTISLDMFYGKSKPPTVITPITTVHNAGEFYSTGAPNLIFGIKALQNIKIVGFDIRPKHPGGSMAVSRFIDFWYRIGVVTDLDIYKSFTEYGWKKITDGNFTHTDALITIPTDTFTPPFSLDIDANVNVCIAIRFVNRDSDILYRSPTSGWLGSLGSTSSTETNVFEVKAGFGSPYLPNNGSFFSNRVFQGNIRYQLR